MTSTKTETVFSDKAMKNIRNIRSPTYLITFSSSVANIYIDVSPIIMMFNNSY